MAPIRLEDTKESAGCLSSIFSSCSRPQQTQEFNEKFMYSAIEPMEQLPAYQDITKVRPHTHMDIYSLFLIFYI